MVRSKSKMEREATGIDAAAKRSERLASLVTLSYEPMLAWRLDGPIEFWNAGAERLYGFASDEAIGRSSHSLLQTKFPNRVRRNEIAASKRRLLVRRTATCLQGHVQIGFIERARFDQPRVVLKDRMNLFGYFALDVASPPPRADYLPSRPCQCSDDHEGVWCARNKGVLRSGAGVARTGGGARGAAGRPPLSAVVIA
jgi:PAS fold